MGNGDRSTARIELLIDRLREAFSIHSGLQQGQAFLSDEEMTKGKQDIKDVVEDVKAILGVDDYIQPSRESMLKTLEVLIGEDVAGTISYEGSETLRDLTNTMFTLGYLSVEPTVEPTVEPQQDEDTKEELHDKELRNVAQMVINVWNNPPARPQQTERFQYDLNIYMRELEKLLK